MKYFKFPSQDKAQWDSLNNQADGSRLVDYLYNATTDEYAAEIPEAHLGSLSERAGDSAPVILAGIVDTLPGFLDDGTAGPEDAMGDWVRP